MTNRIFIRKTLGVIAIGCSLLIAAYLGWFYFVMPRMVDNQKTTLEEIFLKTYTETDEVQPSGVIIGGILYPADYIGNVNASDVTTVELASRAERRGLETLLTVPELDIHNARITLEVDGTDDSIYNTVLRQAVAHFSGTAYPGEKGNVFLFGHSKLPVLAGSDYESIFTNLPRLKNGAIIEIVQGQTKFTYRVNSTAILSPKDVFILNQPEEQRMLTLMTCIPPGFNSKRYVAVASLIEVEMV